MEHKTFEGRRNQDILSIETHLAFKVAALFLQVSISFLLDPFQICHCIIIGRTDTFGRSDFARLVRLNQSINRNTFEYLLLVETDVGMYTSTYLCKVKLLPEFGAELLHFVPIRPA